MAAQPQCPSCGDTDHQRALPSREERPSQAADPPAFRCGKCGRLYLAPASGANPNDD